VNKNMGILELLDHSCQHFKEHIAIERNDKQITYSVLDGMANRLANCLIANQLPTGSMIAVILDDRINIITTLIGIWRAGCVFVPLDPEFPEERLRKMVMELAPDGFITQTKFSRLVAKIVVNNPKTSRRLNLEANNSSETVQKNLIPIVEPLESFSTEKPTVPVDNDAMCYIYHTSGSTGTPKGIAGRLKSISHFIRWEIDTFNVVSGWRMSQFTMPTFDAFLRDVFVALCVGGTICIPPENKKLLDSQTLIDWIDTQQINLIHCVPSLFKLIVAGALDSQQLKSLKYILMAGEVLHVSDVKTWMKTYGNRIQLVNLYGASETTLVKFCHFVQESDVKRGFIPIGKPIKGAKALILDDDKEVCAHGMSGELYIRTPYITLGYYNKPELTQEVFIPNPFSQNPGDLIYKTGDLARVLSDGNFQFLGRKDNQVKIRGIRIELGEIETSLINHWRVKNAVVLLREDIPGDQRLVAYYQVLDLEQEPTTVELRRFLKQRLPEYMIPSIFVKLEVMPLTPHGKIDRQALPKPDQTRQQPEESFVAPRNALEQQLTNIWQQVLGTQPIGIHDNFFDLGGHSLLAITLLTQIEKTFGKRLPLITLFQAPTIAQLTAILKEEGVQDGRMLEIIQSQGTCAPLFFIGSTNYARALAPVLGKNQPVYGLNIFGLQPSNGSIPSLNVKDIARQYCQEIRTVQPGGPYYLCGYCADAKIALEIAQQFQAEGEKIALLAFIDVNWQPQSRSFSIHRHWHNFLEMGFGYLSHKIRQRFNYTKTLLKLSLSKRVETVYRHTRKKSPRQLQDLQFIKSFYAALNNYEPQPYFGQITLFLSHDWRLKHSTVLSQLATGGLEVYEVAGYHDNLFVSPQVEVLGEHLKHCLKNN
jgi:amino acid adenylation domain-containing protein